MSSSPRNPSRAALRAQANRERASVADGGIAAVVGPLAVALGVALGGEVGAKRTAGLAWLCAAALLLAVRLARMGPMSAAFLVVALLLGPGTVRLGLSAHTLLPSLLLAVGGVLMTLDVGGPPVAIVFGTVLVAATVVGASTRIVVTVRPAAS